MNGICSNEDFKPNGTAWTPDECRCICTDNFEGPNCLTNLCENVDCGNGTCIGGNCSCNTGFVNIDNTCEETCTLTPCKNNGTCFDDDGRQKFSCSCDGIYVGERCEINLCDSIDCKNDGICKGKKNEGIQTAFCDCPDNTGGEACEFLSCGSGIPCYNEGSCEDQRCKCKEENGLSKYHGESCDMPRACEGNPCQNGGVCKLIYISDGSQMSECECAAGFEGVFCEHKVEADHLLFISTTVNDFNNRLRDELVFDADGRLIGESAIIGENSGAYRSSTTILNGEAVIFGGNHEEPSNIKRQISVVSECTVKRLGDIPFDFLFGTCGTFMIDGLLTILLCFANENEKRKCRSLTRKNNGSLGSITDFVFDTEFELDRVSIPDSTHDHWMATIANYQGFPLVLGGTNNAKLEMLDTLKSPLKWVEYEGTDYPYQNQLYAYSVISTPVSVIYFGGYHNNEGDNDIVAEYKNLKWRQLGTLSSPRYAHRSIQMGSKIYVIGGWDKTNIEIWENTGALLDPNYKGTLLDNSDNHEFFSYDYGEVIRINHDQCKITREIFEEEFKEVYNDTKVY